MIELSYHSSIAHAAYHDLLHSLGDEVVSDLRGTPTRVERNGLKSAIARIDWLAKTLADL